MRTLERARVGMFLFFLMMWMKAEAQGPTGGTTVSLQNPLGSATFSTVVDKVIDAIITIAAPILAIMVLVGGFQIMIAQGNTEKVTAGRKIITNAIIGFAIILLAKSAQLIVRQILGVQ